MDFVMFFEYNGQVIKLPYLPESFESVTTTENESSNVVGLGEINVIGGMKLQPFTITSFFYRDEDPQPYIDFFIKAQQERKPVRFIFEKMGINKLVSVDSFQITLQSGREEDRLYTLELLEWRDYSPKKIEIETKQTTPQGVEQSAPKEEVKNVTQIQDDKNKIINDIVQFKGGNHYRTSQDKKPTGKPRKAGNAKITLIAKGAKHPFHLIGEPNGSDVYGWVDEGSF